MKCREFKIFSSTAGKSTIVYNGKSTIAIEIKTFHDGGLGFKAHQKAKGPEMGGRKEQKWLHLGLGLAREAFSPETHQSQAWATCEFRR